MKGKKYVKFSGSMGRFHQCLHFTPHPRGFGAAPSLLPRAKGRQDCLRASKAFVKMYLWVRGQGRQLRGESPLAALCESLCGLCSRPVTLFSLLPEGAERL